MSVTIHSHWAFVAESDIDLFAYGDKIMHALLDQEACVDGFTDSAVSADLDHGVLEVEANTAGPDLASAIAVAQSCVRAAAHEVGISTPDWPAHGDTLSMLLKDLRTEQLV